MGEAETRQKLLRNVKKEVKQIMEEAVTRKFVHADSSHIISFCAVVEACVLHGLKRRIAGLLCSNKAAALFMKVAKNFAPAEHLCNKVQELEQLLDNNKQNSCLSNDRSRSSGPGSVPPQARRYLWIRTALMEKSLDKIVLYLVENCSTYYEKEAMLMDPVDGPILASLLVGPCALEYTKVKTSDHYWTDPSADELVQRHRIHSGHSRQDSPSRRPALIQKRQSSGSMDDRPLTWVREYVESLHQNSRTTLLFGKNNVLVQPRDDMEAIPGYLSLHQTAELMTLKWTPNQLMNGNVAELDSEKSVYWDFAMTIRLEEIVYLHCHQRVNSGGTVVLVSQDGIQKPPLHFPKGGHLLQFLTCLETGLLPHGQLDPPLWNQRGKGKVFPKLRKRSPHSSCDSVSDKEDDEATDYVFRILFPGNQMELMALELMDQGVTMWQPSQRESSCSSCSQNGSSDSSLPNGCNHERAPLKLLCDTMKYQIISRAFYGWLAYCRHLSTVRTHLSALIKPIIVDPEVPISARGGLCPDVWSQVLQNSAAFEESEIYRLVFFGGVSPSLRKQVWPFLLGHYHFAMTESNRTEMDSQMQVMYQQNMREWRGCEAIVRQREREKHAEALARCLSGIERSPVQRDSTLSTDSSLSCCTDPQNTQSLSDSSSCSAQVFESIETEPPATGEPQDSSSSTSVKDQSLSDSGPVKELLLPAPHNTSTETEPTIPAMEKVPPEPCPSGELGPEAQASPAEKEAEKAEEGEKKEKAELTEKVEEAEGAEEAEKVKEPEKAEEVKEAEKAEKAEKAEEVKEAEKAEKAEEVKEAEKAEKAEMVEMGEIVEKGEKAEGAEEAEEAEKAEKVDNAKKAEEAKQVEKAEEAEKTEEVESNQSTNPDAADAGVGDSSGTKELSEDIESAVEEEPTKAVDTNTNIRPTAETFNVLKLEKEVHNEYFQAPPLGQTLALQPPKTHTLTAVASPDRDLRMSPIEKRTPESEAVKEKASDKLSNSPVRQVLHALQSASRGSLSLSRQSPDTGDSDDSPSALEMEDMAGITCVTSDETRTITVLAPPPFRLAHRERAASDQTEGPSLDSTRKNPSPEGTDPGLSEEELEMENLGLSEEELEMENLLSEVKPGEGDDKSKQLPEEQAYSQEQLDMYLLNLHRIDKDVRRCDRTYWYFSQDNLEKLRNIMCSYVWLHLDIGYVQGMCDLLAPLLVILDDEVMAFSCFTELMKRMNQNFPHGGAMDTHFANMRSLIQILDSELFELMQQNGDYTHFYFCYRWFLLDFKREMVYDDVFSVWETIWAAMHTCSEHFVLFIALALVETYRDIILENNMDFTDIIKFFNEMAERHDVPKVLNMARDLVLKVQTLLENK
ncbi:unnamed protein product [Knipowitschia caucasica]|uniref:Small G protein signaling modulator 1 n=1 Tax=Knipowitschia caucasica TaxID=637954 RepID=A0AAV2IVT3_KNICA